MSESFPLGKPINRPTAKPDLTSNPQRGVGWHIDRHGRDVYIEPARPQQQSETVKGTAP